MYVDRKLAGLQAVQTLSRLNRTRSGKDQTFILDFQNTIEDIQLAFKPYYEATTVEAMSDPNMVYGDGGVRVVPIDVDEGGLSIGGLEAVLARDPSIRAVYVTPHHQYPTTVTMGAVRRLRLIELARTTPLTILEDDYDHDYRFEGAPVLPIAARAAGDVVYIGSLSKLRAPGIRLGYVVARPDLVARMAMVREAIDRQGDGPLEEAVALMIEDGELARHTRKARRIYHARRDHLAARLTAALPEALAFGVPRGGLALWARIIDGTDAEHWSGTAHRLGLSLTLAARHVIHGLAPDAFRLGYAGLNEQEIDRAVELIKAAYLRN